VSASEKPLRKVEADVISAPAPPPGAYPNKAVDRFAREVLRSHPHATAKDMVSPTKLSWWILMT
jgi:hypothetical protein